jgi:hypothetical protein
VNPAVGSVSVSLRKDDIPANRVVLLRDHEAQAISAAAGVPVPLLHAMTVARYDRRAIMIDHASRRVSLRAMWGRGRGSRYCSGCLADTGGRWQLRWRSSSTAWTCPDPTSPASTSARSTSLPAPAAPLPRRSPATSELPATPSRRFSSTIRPPPIQPAAPPPPGAIRRLPRAAPGPPPRTGALIHRNRTAHRLQQDCHLGPRPRLRDPRQHLPRGHAARGTRRSRPPDE